MEFIRLEKQGGVSRIIFNRPQVFNSFHRGMALELLSVLKEIHSDSSVRCLVLTGEGKAFCAGQDLQEATDPNGPGLDKIIAEHYNPIIRSLRTLEKPVVAAVNGVAAGAGANIALACDIVVASASASFIQAFSKIGLIPDSGGTFFLPRLIGWAKASAIMMTGEKIGAEEARQMGMIYKVFPDDRFQEEVNQMTHNLANMPTRALALTKALLNQSFQQDLEQQLQAERMLQNEAGKTSDFKEGIQAFLEKRQAVFTGQ